MSSPKQKIKLMKKFSVGQKVRIARFSDEMGLLSVPKHMVGKKFTITQIEEYDGIPAARGEFGNSRWFIPLTALANLRRGELTYKDILSPDLIKTITDSPTAEVVRGMIRAQALIAIPKDLKTAEAIFKYIEDQYPYDTSEPPVTPTPVTPINQELEVDVTLTSKRKTVQIETEFWRWSGMITVPAEVVVNGKEAIETWIKANALTQLAKPNATEEENDSEVIDDGDFYDSITEEGSKKEKLELIEIESIDVDEALNDARAELEVAND